MRIWDSLFSDANRFDFLLYMCCSMIVYVDLLLCISVCVVSVCVVFVCV